MSSPRVIKTTDGLIVTLGQPGGGGISQGQLDAEAAARAAADAALAAVDTALDARVDVLEAAGGGGAPSGAAGGVLGGTYPNPSFASDMATQGELNSEITARSAGDSTLTGEIAALAAALAANGRVLSSVNGGARTVYTGDTPPASPVSGDVWISSVGVQIWEP